MGPRNLDGVPSTDGGISRVLRTRKYRNNSKLLFANSQETRSRRRSGQRLLLERKAVYPGVPIWRSFSQEGGSLGLFSLELSIKGGDLRLHLPLFFWRLRAVHLGELLARILRLTRVAFHEALQQRVETRVLPHCAAAQLHLQRYVGRLMHHGLALSLMPHMPLSRYVLLGALQILHERLDFHHHVPLLCRRLRPQVTPRTAEKLLGRLASCGLFRD